MLPRRLGAREAATIQLRMMLTCLEHTRVRLSHANLKLNKGSAALLQHIHAADTDSYKSVAYDNSWRVANVTSCEGPSSGINRIISGKVGVSKSVLSPTF